MLINLDLLSVGIAVAAIGILGFVIFFNRPRSITSKSFLLFALLTIIWGISNYFNYQIRSADLALWVLRAHLFISTWHAFSFFLLSYVFPKEEAHFSKVFRFFILPLVIFTSLVVLTPLGFSKISALPSPGEAASTERGQGIVLFAGLAVFLIIAGTFLLSKKTLQSAETEKTQFKLILFGALTTFLLIIVFNLVLPLAFNELRFIPLGAVFILPFAAFTAYAIIKYHLLNIRVVAAETLMFLVVVVSFSEIIFAQGPAQIVFRISVFVILLFFGILLIRSVRKEVQQRERLEVLTRELDRANAMLVETNAKLEKIDALKSEFVSMAGHQLRGPMTVIKGYISLILEGTIKGASAGVRDALGKAMFSTEQLIKLIAGLLDLSRIEAGKIKYEMVEGDFVRMVSEVIDKFKEGVKKKDIALAFENHAGERAKFAFDQDKIREAVVNYMDNAIKYSSEGGKVDVALDAAGSGADARLRVSVRDHGLGIKHEDIAKLFDKFSRTDEAKNYDPNGMGIGLYFAKRVVQDHGGAVGVESDGIGKGSMFWFELPMGSASPLESAFERANGKNTISKV